jgi:hypothetical protein
MTGLDSRLPGPFGLLAGCLGLRGRLSSWLGLLVGLVSWLPGLLGLLSGCESLWPQWDCWRTGLVSCLAGSWLDLLAVWDCYTAGLAGSLSGSAYCLADWLRLLLGGWNGLLHGWLGLLAGWLSLPSL